MKDSTVCIIDVNNIGCNVYVFHIAPDISGVRSWSEFFSLKKRCGRF